MVNDTQLGFSFPLLSLGPQIVSLIFRVVCGFSLLSGDVLVDIPRCGAHPQVCLLDGSQLNLTIPYVRKYS